MAFRLLLPLSGDCGSIEVFETEWMCVAVQYCHLPKVIDGKAILLR